MKKYIVSICLGMVFLSSCSNWLDVQPKTTVEEEKVFSRELGFKEALTGVYIKMASTDLYARNLSYGRYSGATLSGERCIDLSE